MSTIREQIEAATRKARLERDEPTRNVIGMLKTKLLNELKSGSGAEENDELWLAVIASYAKQAQKTIAEYEKIGDAGKALLEESKFELRFCEQFLPKKLDREATLAILRQIAADNKITDPKQSGKLIGLAIKAHKDELDGDLVRACAGDVFVAG
jgi:uncharacterized protein YqeY